MPILGASSVKKAFTSSHDRGMVDECLEGSGPGREPLVRTDHFFDLILAERCLEPPDRLLVPELEDAPDRVCGVGLGIEGLGVYVPEEGL